MPPLARWLSAQRVPQQRQLHPRPQGRLKFSQSARAHVSRSTTTWGCTDHAFIPVFIRWKISRDHTYSSVADATGRLRSIQVFFWRIPHVICFWRLLHQQSK